MHGRVHYNSLRGFPERLTDSLKASHMDCSKLSRYLGVDRKTVYPWVHGYGMPNALLLAKICKCLNVSADWLLFGGEK